MNTHLLALALATVFVPTAFAGDVVKWSADFDAAAAIAKREKKDLLVDFTGSEWCGWCIRLDKEVFSQDAFASAITEQFVLVALDFDNKGEAKTSAPNPARSNELAQKYEVMGFPTILLMSADGELYGRTGYRQGGPEVYLEHVRTLRESGLRGLALLRDFEAAKDEAKKRAELERIFAFLAEVDASEVASAQALLVPVRSAFELDPENASGLKVRALTALLRAGAADADLIAMARALDPKNAAGALEAAVFAQLQAVRVEEHLEPTCVAALELLETGVIHDEDLAVKIFAYCARWSDQYLGNHERAKRFAARALDFEIDDEEMAADLNAILDAK